MKFNLCWQKPGDKPKSVLQTIDPHFAFSIAMQVISEKIKRGKRVDGNLTINTEEKNPDIYRIVKNGKRDEREEFRFVKDRF